MRKFRRDDLTRFLQSLDGYLSESRRVTLIGGAAASLAYGIVWATTDVDTIDDTADLEEALQLARKATGLNIPFQVAGVFDAPYSSEERLTRVDLGLRKLSVVVPEKHDLTLMKVVRGQDNDREAIQQIADQVGLDKRTLVDRFKSEMTHVIGKRQQLRANFLSIIEMLYGEPEADRINSELGDSDA